MTKAHRPPPLSPATFAVLGAALLIGAVALAALGSFAALAAASVGMFFIAASLVARAATSPGPRAAALLSLGGIALVVFGMVASPLFYLGWALVGAGLIVAAALLSVSGKGTR